MLIEKTGENGNYHYSYLYFKCRSKLYNKIFQFLFSPISVDIFKLIDPYNNRDTRNKTTEYSKIN